MMRIFIATSVMTCALVYQGAQLLNLEKLLTDQQAFLKQQSAAAQQQRMELAEQQKKLIEAQTLAERQRELIVNRLKSCRLND